MLTACTSCRGSFGWPRPNDTPAAQICYRIRPLAQSSCSSQSCCSAVQLQHLFQDFRGASHVVQNGQISMDDASLCFSIWPPLMRLSARPSRVHVAARRAAFSAGWSACLVPASAPFDSSTVTPVRGRRYCWRVQFWAWCMPALWSFGESGPVLARGLRLSVPVWACNTNGAGPAIAQRKPTDSRPRLP